MSAMFPKLTALEKVDQVYTSSDTTLGKEP